MKQLLLALTLLAPLTAFGQHGHPAKEMEPALLVSGLGEVNHPVTTTNPDADIKLRLEHLSGMNSVASETEVQGLRFADVKLRTGVRLRYAEQGNLNGHPLIMLHGYTDSWFSYSRVLRLLDKKYRVYVLDQRGHGDSDRPATGYTFRDFAADVLAFMDAKGLKQATIVGHSMGSFVAQEVAVTAPDRVKRLVLIGTATTVCNDSVSELQRALNNLSDPVPVNFVREFQVGTVFQPLPDEFLERVISESLKLPAQAWRQVMSGMLRSPSASAPLSKIRMPTLILWGDRETIFPRAEQDALASAIPHAVLKVYPETGHGLHWEQPEEFVKDLDEFIHRTQ